MSLREDVPPDTLGVELSPEGVVVRYLDGREVFYRGVPKKATGSVVCGPGKDVHVLVTDDSETEGVLLYVNDRQTRADILEDTGVGRVIVETGETASLFPGVTAAVGAHRIEVAADIGSVDGRVFVFAEDDMREQSYEIVAGE